MDKERNKRNENLLSHSATAILVVNIRCTKILEWIAIILRFDFSHLNLIMIQLEISIGKVKERNAIQVLGTLCVCIKGTETEKT